MDKKGGTVAIIGSGLIGKSWAMLFAAAGYNVHLHDTVRSQMDAAMTEIHQRLKELELGGNLRGSLSAEEQYKLISTSSNLTECVKDAQHVQECVPDSIDLKRKVFEELDALCTETMVLSSSSSVHPASSFTENLTNRHRCLISHPVNPPYFMTLVELVPAPWTSPEVVTSTRALMEKIGQSPVTLKKEIAGFIQPRVQYAIVQEAVRLVRDGVVSAEGIDSIMTDGPGLRYSFIGPFETATLNAEGFRSYVDRYADMIHGVTSDSGPAVDLKNNEELRCLYEQMNKMVPLENLAERRRWRDEGIMELAKLRQRLDREKQQ